MQEIKQLLAITLSLKEKYKQHNKSFTLAGKLVGNIGEVLMAEYYGLTLYDNNTPIHDGFVIGNESKKVQIEASLNNYFYFTKDIKNIPQYFISVKLHEDGSFTEIYNGTSILINKKMQNYKGIKPISIFLALRKKLILENIKQFKFHRTEL